MLMFMMFMLVMLMLMVRSLSLLRLFVNKFLLQLVFLLCMPVLVNMPVVVRAVGFMTVVVVVPPAQVVMSVTRVEDLHLDEVEGQAQHSHYEHNVTLHVRTNYDPQSRLPHEPNSKPPDEDDTHEGSDYLRPVVSIGERLSGGFLSHLQGYY